MTRVQQLRQFTWQTWFREFENIAQSKPTGTANWYLKCSHGQLSTRIPPGVLKQAQWAIHQLKLNRLSFTASYQALIGKIPSPTCPHCGSGDEMVEHLLLLYPWWAAERQRYFGDSTDITDVFKDYDNLVEFLISSGHLSPPHISSAWWARHDNNNNNLLSYMMDIWMKVNNDRTRLVPDFDSGKSASGLFFGNLASSALAKFLHGGCYGESRSCNTKLTITRYSPSNAYIATHVPMSPKSSSKLSCSTKYVVLTLASSELSTNHSNDTMLSRTSDV